MIEQIELLVKNIRERFEHDEKAVANFVSDVVKAFAHRDALIGELQAIVVQLRKEVTDLQSQGIEKVLLEESKENAGNTR